MFCSKGGTRHEVVTNNNLVFHALLELAWTVAATHHGVCFGPTAALGAALVHKLGLAFVAA